VHDVQAAKLFFERRDKHLERESPKRRLEDAINVTPQLFLTKAGESSEEAM